jgi:D-galacturonate reductase
MKIEVSLLTRKLGEYLQKKISEVYNGLNVSFESYPSDNMEDDPTATETAINALSPGDAVLVLTRGATHYALAMYAVRRGLHVLIRLPAVETTKEHRELIDEAKKHNVFVYVEYHRRYDPANMYIRDRARTELGDFNYFYSYMALKRPLVGKDLDISYYLNSHHIDVNDWMVPDYEPLRVTATASKGFATELEDDSWTASNITLAVDWGHPQDKKKRATGIYTARWAAAHAAPGGHPNEYYDYMGSNGELRIEGNRGYGVANTDGSISWVDP